MSDEFVQAIGKLVGEVRQLARQAEQQYTVEVEAVLQAQSHACQRIERLLDGMLDFGFDAATVSLYGKLCRYFFDIDAETAVFYVKAYRDMWDEEESS